MSKWISVDIKLPPINKKDKWAKENMQSDEVWCWVKGHCGAQGRYFHKSNHWTVNGWLGDFKVTHWMPLPEPPKV